MRRVDGSRLFVLEGGEPLAKLFELGEGYDAIAYEHEGDWYLFGSGELARLRRELPASTPTARALGNRRKAAIIRGGAKPSRPAVVVDAQGRVSAVWLPGLVGKKRRVVPDSQRLRGRPAPRRSRRRESAALEVDGGGGDGSPPDGDGPDGPGAETIYRTPHLDAPEEIPKKPGAELTVSVYVDTKELRAGESGEGIELDLPAGMDSVEVGVLLGLTGPFELCEGSEYRTLTIARDEEESARLDFKLRVGAVEEPGPAAISALFTLRGRACGQVARAWDWSSAGEQAPSVAPEAAAPVSMPMHIVATQPSLSIIITAPAGGTDYRVSVQAPALKGYERPSDLKEFSLPPEAAAFRKDLLKALTAESDTAEERFLALKRLGYEAWESAPQIVKDVLWAMVDAGVPPTTIYIATVEPILPWELMIPRRFDGPGRRELDPLGVEFAIGRWTRADSQSPSPTLRIDRSFVIAPVYSKDQLEYEDELKLVESRLRGERIEPATAKYLDEHFEDEHASLLHFVCHGTAGKRNDDAIALDGGKLMMAGEMEARKGFKALCQAMHPLVFLNSCSTGQMVPSLAGGAGFPKSFGNIGANAIIAPLWSVDDELAGKIALELYEAALEPGAGSLPSILQGIRRRGFEEENADTYAAYCFFGDPEARLELAEAAD